MKSILSIFIFVISFNAFAVDFDKTAGEIETELKQTNAKLDTARSRIFTERQKLTREISQAKAQAESSKKSTGSMKQERDKLLREISELDKEIIANQNSAIDLLKSSIQLRRELETVIPQIKISQFKKFLADQDDALTKRDITSFLNRFSQLNTILLEDGGKLKITEVEAVSKTGEIVQAKLISIGHSHDYLLIDGSGGLAVQNPNHDHPGLKTLPGITAALQSVVSNGSGQIPFDFSNGLALKKAAKEKTFSDQFKSGGAIMYPLAFLALICIIVGIWKTVQLYIIRSGYDDKVRKVLTLIKNGELEEAQKYVDSLRDPIKKLLNQALKHKGTSRENLEELLNENILAQIPKLDRFMPVLSVSAGAAPLLGLLGTVMGIIKTFEMISLYGTGDPNTMAGGISEALVTTQAGLMVAIPALIWHAVLNRRLKAIVGNLEKATLSFINGLSIEESDS